MDMETKQTNSNGQFRPFSKEVAMFFSSLSAAFSEATPAACKALIAQGIKFVVAVENQRGEWFLLHAEDQNHAGTLARNWVDTLGARGASAWRLFDFGPSNKPFMTAFEEPEYYEDAA
jgi:hypothetical protein